MQKKIFILTFLVLSGILFFISNLSVTNLINLRVSDIIYLNLFNFTKPVPPIVNKYPEIMLIDIDENFIRSIKKYPLPRKYYAFLLEILNEKSIKSVGFGVIFCDGEHDKLLAEKVNGNVVLPYYFDKYGNEIMPEKYLLCNCHNLGYLNVTLDRDGVLRKINPFRKNKNGKVQNHFIIELLQKSYPEIFKTQNKNNILNFDNNNIFVDKTNFYINTNNNDIKNNITEINYLDFYNKIKSGELKKDLSNTIAIIGIKSNFFNREWATSELKSLSSNYILGASLLTLISQNIFHTSTKILNNSYAIISILIIFLFLYFNLYNIFTKKKIIIFIIFLLLIYIFPFILFYNKILIPYFSMYFIITTTLFVLVILRFFLKIIFYDKQLKDNNFELQEKLEIINELNSKKTKAYNKINDIEKDLINQKKYSEFARNFTHEIRNPLSLITLIPQILKKKHNLPEEKKDKYFNTLLKVSKKINKIMDKIRLLTFIESDVQKLKLKPISSNSLVSKVISDYEKGLSLHDNNKKCFFKFSAEKDFYILGDSTLLEQVLINFIDNSIKYSRDMVPSKIEISIISKNDKEICIIIEDNGIGLEKKIEPEELFNRNFRVNNNDDNGEGLGLNIVKKILSLHNGSAIITNKGKNIGLIVEITLPIK